MAPRARVALLFGLALCVLGLGGAEGWQRRRESSGRVQVVSDPPGLKYSLRGGDPADLERGWREDVQPSLPTEGQRTILCVGDSLTFGVGVSRPQAWPAQLERSLGTSAWKVHNFGVAGYDAEQIATLLEARMEAFAPDLVVWGAYVNDRVPTYLLYGAGTDDAVFVGTSVPASARILPDPIAVLLLRHSALFRRLQGSVYARNVDPAEAVHPFPGWYERQLDRIAGWAQRREVPLVVLWRRMCWPTPSAAPPR